MEDVKTRATAIINDYITQMRTAGFDEESIRKRLLETTRTGFSVPEQEGYNLGQAWSAGMGREFMGESPTPQNETFAGKRSRVIDLTPGPDEYMEYKEGHDPSRVPTYEEFSQRGANLGGFKGTQNVNLMNALKKRLESYSGPRVGAGQSAYEMGIVGMPQELGNQWIPEFLQLAEGKANEARGEDELNALRLQYPEIDIKEGDTAEVIAGKIRDYNLNAAYQEKTEMPSIIAALDSAVYEKMLASLKPPGVDENGTPLEKETPPTVEEVMSTGMQLGLKLTFDQASAIFTAARARALQETE